jgi:hypothetical protein
VHRKTRIRSGSNKTAEEVREKIKKQREGEKERKGLLSKKWRCFQLVGKPQSYMNTTSRSNVHLNAPIRSKLGTPIGKTKTKKIGEQRKKEKELTLVHCCQQIKRKKTLTPGIAMYKRKGERDSQMRSKWGKKEKMER